MGAVHHASRDADDVVDDEIYDNDEEESTLIVLECH